MANQEPSTIALTRHQLFERVRTTPMIRLAKDFGLSDVGLRKTCQRYNIPTPPAGYWSKKRHGKAGPVPGLPPEDDGSCDVIRFEPPTVMDDDEMKEQRKPRHADVALALEREKSAPRIEVGELGPHLPRVVASTYRALTAAKPDKYGESFGRVGTSSHSGEFLNVNIGPNSIDRCIRFLNALIRALEARGFKLMYKDQGHDKGLRLVILGEELFFRIFESSRRKHHVLTAEEREEKKRYPNSSWHKKFDFDPCGQLEFSVRAAITCSKSAMSVATSAATDCSTPRTAGPFHGNDSTSRLINRLLSFLDRHANHAVGGDELAAVRKSADEDQFDGCGGRDGAQLQRANDGHVVESKR